MTSAEDFTFDMTLQLGGEERERDVSERERVNPIFSTVLSQNSKLLVIAQLHPRSTEHLMSNIHLHNTIQHAFAALMQVQTSHLCIAILSHTSCTHHHQQRRRQWIIVAVPTETKLDIYMQGVYHIHAGGVYHSLSSCFGVCEIAINLSGSVYDTI